MVQKVVTGFSGGMDKDTTFTKYDPSNYLDAENLRIIIDQEGSSGTLNTVKGNTLDFELANREAFNITSFCVTHDYLTIFATNTRDEILGVFNASIIDIQNYNGTYPISMVYSLSTGTVYNVDRCIGRFEYVDGINDRLKVYFTESTTQTLCVIDVLNPPVYTVLEHLGIVPEFLVTPCDTIVEVTGSIKTGVVQYAYQLYTANGQETMFSPATRPITVTKSQSTAKVKEYKGNPSGEISSKGFQFNIDIDSVPFNRIRVVRLYYETLNTLPQVIIIYEGSITSGSSITVTDSGQSFGSYTIEEFRYISNILYPKYIEEKNNYLFAANITEDVFDVPFDARAYRYRSNLTTYVPNTSQVETYNVVNPYNDITNDTDITKAYKYQSDGLTFGGTGINVSYTFVQTSFILDDLSNATLVTGDATNSNCNPLKDVGYQRDEIYRFAIVLYDNYGRNSFVKWIDDIRFPDANDYPIITQAFGVQYAMNLGISFKVTNLPAEVYAYQIVRCKRDEANRTVVDCGICGHTEKVATGQRGFVGGLGYTLNPRLMNPVTYNSSGDTSGKNLLEYITPEYNYNGKRVLSANYLYTWSQATTSSYINNTLVSLSGDDALMVKKIKEYDTGFNYILDINSTESFILNHDSTLTTTTIDSTTVRHQITMYNGSSAVVGVSGKGSTMIIVLTDDFNPTSNTGPVYVYRRNAVIPYGGASYSARQNSSYYACGDLITRPNFSAAYNSVFNGDTYIVMYEYNRGILLQNALEAYDFAEILHFPVETTINTNLTSNPTFNSQHDGSTNYVTTPLWSGMSEEAGVYSVANDASILFAQDYNLYTYNSVYSQQDESRVFIMKPLDFNLSTTKECEITCSEKKVEYESVDSWCKFKFNNKIDVNAKFGRITGLANFKNILMFTQPDGYGIISVEDREAQPSSNIGGYVLGTGGPLTRFDYVNTDIGVKESVSGGLINLMPTTDALYMYDSDRKKLFRYTGEHEVLSDKYGLMSLMSTMNASYPDFSMGYNRKYGEVYFSNSYLNKTIVFSEFTNSFVSSYKMYSKVWIPYKNSVWTLKHNIASDVDEFYLEDSSTSYNTFYGVYTPSTLTFIVNPQGIQPVRFDMIQFNTESSVDGQSLTSIQFDNSYQTSGVVVLSRESVDEELSNYRRRFRTFRFNTIFDTDENRFKDNYLKCKVTYTDTTPFTTSLQIGDIITGYTQLPTK